ncbi:MAG TPA: DUF2087 domain-containing protein [Anaerolineales bacterium]|nr:DUF2087 domain-containing protein [Anaerolineales bacterium]
MSDDPRLLDFVKAMSDVDRLRIIGLLAQRAAPLAEIAAELGIHPKDAFGHISFMGQVGIIRKENESYELDENMLETLSKTQFARERETYVPAPDLDRRSRKVLASYLNSDGTVKQIPSQPAKLKIILQYLAEAFEPSVNYTEKEVNTILRRFHVDVSSLRRYLIDAELLKRESDGSRYWRIV